MKKMLMGLVAALLSLTLNAQMLKVGLYQDHLLKSVVLSCVQGSYTIVLDGEITGKLMPGDVFYVSHEGRSMRILDESADLGLYGAFELRSLSSASILSLRPVDPDLQTREYEDNMHVLPRDRFITLVNEVDMDKYLAGVVEAEAGPGATKEFYKAQSVLCRTYALKQMERHQEEGFALCDQFHCQAYKGRSVQNPQIMEAIAEAGPLVLADYNYKLITAAYHANSGGQTQRASDVWLKDFPYLQSVVDPYSLHQKSAKWRDTIAFKDWKAYLIKSGVEAAGRVPEEIMYVEQLRRKKHFVLDGDSIRITKIRDDWGFRSAFFDMFPDGDRVLVWGKGFGHGIGLSQEGAMKMAADGYDFRDILQFYFYEVRLMDYRDLPRSSLPASFKKP